MSRKTAFVGFSYMAGLLLASFFSAPLSIAIGAVLLGFGLCTVFFFRPKHSGSFYRSAVCAIACCVGLWIYSGYDMTVCRNITANIGNFSGTVTIEQSTVYSEEKAFYIAHCTFPNGASGNMGFFDRRSDLVKGDKITLSGQLYAPENTGFFNSADYYRSMNVFLLMKSVRTSGYEIKEHNFYRTLDDFRHNVSDTIRKYVPSEEGELLIGMLFGSSDIIMIPTGTELTAPLVAIAVISAALCLILTHDKMYFVLTCLSAALVSVVCIEIYRLIPTGYTEISVLTDGSGCVIVVKNDSCSQIYDYMGTRSGAKAAYRSIAGSGGSAAAFAAVTKQCAYSESVYKGLFEGIAVLSTVTKSGLTYSAEDNIIKFGNTVYYPHENYSIIETDGVKILCVTGKAELPDERFDLCIYSCSADVYADAAYYTVADSDFKGKISPFGSTGTEYIADNGVLYPKEGVSWLR